MGMEGGGEIKILGFACGAAEDYGWGGVEA